MSPTSPPDARFTWFYGRGFQAMFRGNVCFGFGPAIAGGSAN